MNLKNRIVNIVGPLINSLGYKWPNFDIEKLKSKAIDITGYNDFGDNNYREGLEVLIKSVLNEANLHTIGKFAFYHEIIALLVSRLTLQREKTIHPEIFTLEIRSPIIIAGLPRTGTTILHSLLALDPQFRSPLVWEMNLYPHPPSASRSANLDRINRSKGQVEHFKNKLPNFDKIHMYDAELPQECILITAMNFCSPYFEVKYHIPTYQKWYTNRDKSKNYHFHKEVLQYLQGTRESKTWLLKTPFYIGEFDDLFKEYPEARIIQTHRDPKIVIHSIANLYHVLRLSFSKKVNKKMLGKEIFESWAWRLEKGLNFRKNNLQLSTNFYDIDFSDFAKDQIGVIKRIYEYFSLNLTSETEKKMIRFLDQNKRIKYAKPAAVDFGLEEIQLSINSLFKSYLNTYIDENKNYE